MHHIQTSVYHVTGGTDEVQRRADVDLFPLLRRQAGFIACDLTQSEEQVALTSTWLAREQAEMADRLSASWVRENFTVLAVQVKAQSIAPVAPGDVPSPRPAVRTAGRPEQEFGT
ncbi:MAG TPA: hypothetical protein VFN57_04665 [Thermomicrobiaceae bacterium]|nr:hypothetical protein [Thermomicrobiaceae bacterium]